VTAIAPDAKKLTALDEDTRVAWSTYRERLRGLSGAEYELVEYESWAELQSALRRVERCRRSLTQDTTA
jgi:hypothetical protein